MPTSISKPFWELSLHHYHVAYLPFDICHCFYDSPKARFSWWNFQQFLNPCLKIVQKPLKPIYSIMQYKMICKMVIVSHFIKGISHLSHRNLMKGFSEVPKRILQVLLLLTGVGKQGKRWLFESFSLLIRISCLCLILVSKAFFL